MARVSVYDSSLDGLDYILKGSGFDRVNGQTVGWRLSRAVKVWRFVRRDAVRECLPIPGQPESIRLARERRTRDEGDRHGVEHSAKRSKRSASF